MSDRISLKPVGVIRTEYSDREVSESWPRGVKGVIEVFEEFADGVAGLEGFSHLIVLAWLHKVSEMERRVLRVKYRRFTRLGLRLEDLPEVGVFASDSPHRPNPIALSIVKITGLSGRRIYVDGLDLYDGTPVIDLRPYTPFYYIEDAEIPEWFKEIISREGLRSR